jgi:hypothetical protein
VVINKDIAKDLEGSESSLLLRHYHRIWLSSDMNDDLLVNPFQPESLKYKANLSNTTPMA